MFRDGIRRYLKVDARLRRTPSRATCGTPLEEIVSEASSVGKIMDTLDLPGRPPDRDGRWDHPVPVPVHARPVRTVPRRSAGRGSCRCASRPLGGGEGASAELNSRGGPARDPAARRRQRGRGGLLPNRELRARPGSGPSRGAWTRNFSEIGDAPCCSATPGRWRAPASAPWPTCSPSRRASAPRSSQRVPGTWSTARSTSSTAPSRGDAPGAALAEKTPERCSGPAFEHLGWERAAGEDERAQVVRATLLRRLGTTGRDVGFIRTEATARFDAGVVEGDLASAVVAVVASMVRPGDYDEPAAPGARREGPADRGALPPEAMLAAVADEAAVLCPRSGLAGGSSLFRMQDAPIVIARLMANPVGGRAVWQGVASGACWDERRRPPQPALRVQGSGSPRRSPTTRSHVGPSSSTARTPLRQVSSASTRGSSSSSPRSALPSASAWSWPPRWPRSRAASAGDGALTSCDASTATTDKYRLPTTVSPSAYRTSRLELDLLAATFVGAVEIDLDVRVTTSTILRQLDRAGGSVTRPWWAQQGDRRAPRRSTRPSSARRPSPGNPSRSAATCSRSSSAGCSTSNAPGLLPLDVHRRRRHRPHDRDHPVRVDGRAPGVSMASTSRRSRPTYEVTLLVPAGLSAYSNSPVAFETPARRRAPRGAVLAHDEDVRPTSWHS